MSLWKGDYVWTTFQHTIFLKSRPNHQSSLLGQTICPVWGATEFLACGTSWMSACFLKGWDIYSTSVCEIWLCPIKNDCSLCGNLKAYIKWEIKFVVLSRCMWLQFMWFGSYQIKVSSDRFTPFVFSSKHFAWDWPELLLSSPLCLT